MNFALHVMFFQLQLTTEIERLREIHVDHLKEIQQYKREKEKLQVRTTAAELLQASGRNMHKYI